MTETNGNQGDPQEPIENNVAAYIKQGEAYYSKGDYDRAITAFSKAIELDSNNTEVYKRRGISYHFNGNYASAIRDFNKAIKLKPKDADTYKFRGIVYHTKGNYCRAIRDFNKAIKLKPKDTNTYEWRGLTYHKNGNYDCSLDDFLEVDKRDPRIKFNNITIYIAFCLKDLKQCRGETFNILLDLSSAIRMTQSRLFQKPQNRREVAHYTSLHTLKNLVGGKGRFRLYNAAYMNDPEEGDVFSQIMEKHDVNVKDDFYPDISSYISPAYIGSFVTVDSGDKQKDEKKDKLFLWRTYGKHDGKEAGGACLVFKHDGDCFAETLLETIGKMDQLDDKESQKILAKPPLYKVAYQGEIKELEDELGKVAVSLQKIKDKLPKDKLPEDMLPKDKLYKDTLLKLVRELLDEIRFLFKADHYKEEKELRAICVRDSRKENQQQGSDEVKIDMEKIPPRFYLETDKDFRFNEVILGPNAQRPAEWKKWLKQQWKGLTVEESKIKYRNS